MGGSLGGSGGGQTTQTIQKSDPWDEQKPYLTRGFQEAQNIFLNSPAPQFYPGSTIVPFSPETNAALSMQTSRALNGSPIQTAGTDQLAKTLSGDYLNQISSDFNNPMQQQVNQNLLSTIRGDNLYGGAGFNAALDAASNRILPQVDSAFERSGRTGSGLAQVAKTQALGDAFAAQYGQERQNQLAASQMAQQNNQALQGFKGQERENQMRSMLFAPQMASLDYQDAQKLAEVGAQKESLQQQQLAENMARYNYNQNIKGNQLANYMGLIQGNYGGTATGTETKDAASSGRNPLLGGMGGLLSSSYLGVNPVMGLLMGMLG